MSEILTPHEERQRLMMAADVLGVVTDILGPLAASHGWYLRTAERNLRFASYENSSVTLSNILEHNERLEGVRGSVEHFLSLATEVRPTEVTSDEAKRALGSLALTWWLL